jgi:hypothetical protein
MTVKASALDRLIERRVRQASAERTKASATSPLVVPPHGPNALFNTPGLGRGIVNALISPLQGFYGFLEARGHVHTTRYVNPVFGILTGQTASTGDEPTENCAPGRRPGNLKLCKQVWPFGQITMNSGVISLLDAGQVNNTGESLDLQLIGNPFAELSSVVPTDVRQLFINKQAKALIELVNAMRRDYGGLVFTGNPQSTAGNAGGYKEYNGLDRIINDGYVDSETGTACAAANSTIVTNLDGLNVADNAEEYVATMVEAYDLVQFTARQARLGDIQWAFIGRRGFFRALTEVWPCTYRTYRCNLDGNSQAQHGGGDAPGRVPADRRRAGALHSGRLPHRDVREQRAPRRRALGVDRLPRAARRPRVRRGRVRPGRPDHLPGLLRLHRAGRGPGHHHRDAVAELRPRLGRPPSPGAHRAAHPRLLRDPDLEEAAPDLPRAVPGGEVRGRALPEAVQ